MKGATALLLAAAATVLAAGAFLVLRQQEAPPPAPGARALPALAGQAAAITAVEVLRGNATIRLERDGTGAWIVASSDGYPSRSEVVRALVTSLVELTVDEPMTAKRDRHGEIGLAWPDASGRARRVRLLSSAPIVDVVVGDERAQPPSLFLRTYDDAQAWRARGRVIAPGEALEWMDREIMALPESAVQAVTLRGLTVTRVRAPSTHSASDAPPAQEPGERPGRDTWMTSAAPEAAWTPEGVEMARSALVSMPIRLEFEGVRRARAEAAPEERYSPVFLTDDGTIALAGHREPDGVWIRVTVTPGSAASRLETLAARVHGWEYRLPTWIGDSLDRMAAAPGQH